MQRAALLVGAALLTGATTADAAPQFTATVSPVRWADVRYSWRPGCPVAPGQLRLVRLRVWGFDGHSRLGRLVVHARVTGGVVAVFRRLYQARFPIRRMAPVSAYGGSDDASMAADNTSGFNCRAAVGSASRRWSAHAYGLAIDVNPVENPYLLRGKVLPPAGRAFVDRTRRRPGMAGAGGVLVRAFAAAGWEWGGLWRGSPDYQHFSAH